MRHADDRVLYERVIRASESKDAIVTRILIAAREQFETLGLHRSTIDDVARRAGLSRITIYRRFPTKNDLVTAVLLREARHAFGQINAAIELFATVEERVVEGFVITLRIARTHPLLTRLLALEPDVLLPHLTLRAGPLLAVYRTFLAEHIRRAQDRGALPAYDPNPIAELLVRLCQSFLLTPDGVIDLSTDRKTRAFARRFLAPIITGGGRGKAAGA